MSEFGYAADSMGVRVGLAPWRETGHEEGHFTVRRWDAEQTDWASRKLGGEGTGRRGFVPVNDVVFRSLKIDPYSVTTSLPHEHNLITTGGWDRVLSLAAGLGGATFGSATCRIWVGTGTAAASSGDVNLSAATSGGTARFCNLVTGNGATSPGTAVRRLSFTATFATGDANFVWAEWAIDNGGTGSGTGAVTTPLLCHAISAQGTKVSGQTWTATANLDFT